jgi:fatty-acyl-CoA synthase
MNDTVYSLIAHAAARNPGATAITFLPTLDAEPERITYGAFLARLHQTARLFRELGVARNDVVTLLVPPIPEAVAALWAAEAVGIAHPVNTLLRAEAIAAMMRAANTRLLVVPGPQLDVDLWEEAVAAAQMTPSLAAVVVLGDLDPGSGYVHLGTRLPEDGGRLEDEPSPQDVAAIFHTGGTSGAPKLARDTHANQAFAARTLATGLGFDGGTRLVNGLPLYHVAGAIACTLSPLGAGSEVLIPTANGLRDRDVIAGHWRMVERLRPPSSAASRPPSGPFSTSPRTVQT